MECYSVAPAPGVARVLGDNIDAMRQAVTHLAEFGHERIAHLAGPHSNLEAQERMEGFRAAMRATFGPDCWDDVVQGDTWGEPRHLPGGGEETSEQARPLAEAILAMNVTAVVCANDWLALALWQAASERGIRVPQDLSLTGMDNTLPAAYKGLTSVATPFEQIGRAAVDAFLTLQNGGNSAQASRVLPVELIQRSSVAVPNRQRKEPQCH